MQKTPWLDIRIVVEKDGRYIFICEDIMHVNHRVTAPKNIFGIVRNRRPRKGERISFHLVNNQVVGFERYID